MKLWYGLTVIGVDVLMSVFARWLVPHSPTAQVLALRLRPPLFQTAGAGTLWLGSDDLGRDVLARLIEGAHVSLLVGALGAAIAVSSGVPLGLVAGFLGGPIRNVVLRMTDVFLPIPFLLLAVAIVAALGPGLVNLFLALGFTRWPRFTRVSYAATLEVRERPFVEASVAAGAASSRLLFRHVLPNIASAILVVATLEFSNVILFESALSFLGLGVQPPAPSWGNMVAEGQDYIGSAWWLITFPGLAILLTVTGINLIGDCLRDRFDPRSRLA
jgi:peptide/nickel transport system permease protein